MGFLLRAYDRLLFLQLPESGSMGAEDSVPVLPLVGLALWRD